MAWLSSNTYVYSNAAFLFSLSLRGVPNWGAARQCKLTDNSHAIYGGENNHATFGAGHDLYHATYGAGHDLHFCDNCAHTSGSYSDLGNSYQNDGNMMLLCGIRNFQILELEVFQIRK